MEQKCGLCRLIMKVFFCGSALGAARNKILQCMYEQTTNGWLLRARFEMGNQGRWPTIHRRVRCWRQRGEHIFRILHNYYSTTADIVTTDFPSGTSRTKLRKLTRLLLVDVFIASWIRNPRRALRMKCARIWAGTHGTSCTKTMHRHMQEKYFLQWRRGGRVIEARYWYLQISSWKFCERNLCERVNVWTCERVNVWTCERVNVWACNY